MNILQKFRFSSMFFHWKCYFHRQIFVGNMRHFSKFYDWKFTEKKVFILHFSCKFHVNYMKIQWKYAMHFHWKSYFHYVFSLNFAIFSEFSLKIPWIFTKKMKIQWIYIFIFSKYSFPENSVKISWKFSEYWKFGAKFAEYSVYFPQKCIFMM